MASNAGHCLWSGIVPPERAAKVVKRLMAPDMWSGWGIRTLSADIRRSIHTTIRPDRFGRTTTPSLPWVSNATASAPKRRGSPATSATPQAISCLISCPSSTRRSTATKKAFPVQYLGANVPQAWAAGSVFALLQAILGFMPDAPRGKLHVDPVLPEWLPDLTVLDLHVGQTPISTSASGARAARRSSRSCGATRRRWSGANSVRSSKSLSLHKAGCLDAPWFIQTQVVASALQAGMRSIG